MLGVLLAWPQPNTPQSDFLSHSICQINRIKALASYRGLISCTARPDCCPKVTPRRSPRNSHFNVEPGSISVARCLKRLKEESTQIRRHLPLIHPRKAVIRQGATTLWQGGTSAVAMEQHMWQLWHTPRWHLLQHPSYHPAKTQRGHW